MQLTFFSDYSLRVLVYLASHRPRVVAVQEIATAYGISAHHLVKVAKRLVDEKLIESSRGRGGGLRLAKEPHLINLGAVIRATEPDFTLVECFAPETNTCPIEPACGMRGVLHRAKQAFLAELDRHTLADCLNEVPVLLKLWKRRQDVSQSPGR